jgi:hypothetical protein
MDALDLDRKHRHSAKWWVAYRDHLPVTRVHRTRSGGLHLCFGIGRASDARPVESRPVSMSVVTAVISFGGLLRGWRCCAMRRLRPGQSGCASSYHHYSGRGSRT